MPARRLSDTYRTAFVTGASGGLGGVFVRMLLEEGVAVWGTARDASRLRTHFDHGARFTAVELDLADSEGAVGAFESARAATGEGVFDIVIQNAGYGVFGPFAGTDWSLWESQLQTMLVTTARLSHAALASWGGSRREACLVHVSSMAVEFPIPFLAGYNMVKAGLSALSESLDLETRGSPVRVIDFRPGDYRTGFNQAQLRPSSTQDSAPGGRKVAPARGDAAALERVWGRLEENLNEAPEASRAAEDLRRALLCGKRGRLRSGGVFQTGLAPFLARFDPSDWRLRMIARYFNLHR